ncbi:phosphoenolpyruvate synthase [Candidatus Wolfebacteria bacterium]|nr:phosphoenolpyruvate synthase [Candidatus Wolfebacteria bacterium]
MKPFIKQFKELSIKDIPEAGGKNASLGEMIKNLTSKGVKIPDGFITTSFAFYFFMKESGLDNFVKKILEGLDTHNLFELARRGKLIRETIKKAKFPKILEEQIIKAYKQMEKEYGKNVDVAVRSSATAEDVPEASFAGQHETYLNISGEKGVLIAVKSAMASLFTNRAISYRVDKGFSHFDVALSVGVQKMVRSDLGCSGVIFTLDTESGFKDTVLINGSWGLGEMIVQGEVTPDEFLVFKKTGAVISKQLGTKSRKMIYSGGAGLKKTKIVNVSEKERNSFVLTNKEIQQLAKEAMIVERHYSKKYKRWSPMDLEWAKDGKTGELYIIQARPETVHSLRDLSKIKEYVLEKNQKSKILVKGISVGSKIATGKANIILSAKDIRKFKPGEILVTDMTDPDWEPIMKIASAIVTDKGGRTSHAAIVSRELGIPCIVGSENATRKIKTGQFITVDTTGSDGLVFDGALKFKIIKEDIKKIPKVKTKIMMNLATPETAFEKSFLPNDGVGLAREEFIIASEIGIHPMALINYKKLPLKIKKVIDKKTIGYKDKTQFYIDKLAFGIAKISAAFYPKPVIVRFSDFKTNEYRSLIGGDLYEPKEENPMLGWRGASRYYHSDFSPAFVLELKAIKKVRNEMGLTNTQVMIPFCRTVEEGKKVLEIMAKNGLKSGKDLKIYVMCEIPSNVILADEFLKIFDGMSIGSNDLTQLTVGIDRDASELLRGVADEKDESIKKLISEVIKKCQQKKKYVGICGQAPSDYPEFAEFLVKEGIESMSLNPDTIIKTILRISKKEK